MVYVSDIMQKKVRGWIVVAAMLGLTIAAAWAISARAAEPGFFGGRIQSVVTMPAGGGTCFPGQTLVVLQKGTTGGGHPWFCYDNVNPPLVGPSPAKGMSVLGMGKQKNPLLFFTSK